MASLSSLFEELKIPKKDHAVYATHLLDLGYEDKESFDNDAGG